MQKKFFAIMFVFLFFAAAMAAMGMAKRPVEVDMRTGTSNTGAILKGATNAVLPVIGLLMLIVHIILWAYLPRLWGREYGRAEAVIAPLVSLGLVAAFVLRRTWNFTDADGMQWRYVGEAFLLTGAVDVVIFLCSFFSSLWGYKKYQQVYREWLVGIEQMPAPETEEALASFFAKVLKFPEYLPFRLWQRERWDRWMSFPEQADYRWQIQLVNKPVNLTDGVYAFGLSMEDQQGCLTPDSHWAAGYHADMDEVEYPLSQWRQASEQLPAVIRQKHDEFVQRRAERARERVEREQRERQEREAEERREREEERRRVRTALTRDPMSALLNDEVDIEVFNRSFGPGRPRPAEPEPEADEQAEPEELPVNSYARVAGGRAIELEEQPAEGEEEDESSDDPYWRAL